MPIRRQRLVIEVVSVYTFQQLAQNTAALGSAGNTMIFNAGSDSRINPTTFQRIPLPAGKSIAYTAECDSQQAFGWGKEGARKPQGKRTARMVYVKVPRRDANGHIVRDKYGRIKYDLDRSRQRQQTIIKKPDARVQSYPVAIQFFNVDIENGEKPNISRNTCQVYCGCPAYYFYFSYENFNNNCHYGKKPVLYKHVIPPSGRPELNPKHIPGVCKHLLIFADQLRNGREIE